MQGKSGRQGTAMTPSIQRQAISSCAIADDRVRRHIPGRIPKTILNWTRPGVRAAGSNFSGIDGCNHRGQADADAAEEAEQREEAVRKKTATNCRPRPDWRRNRCGGCGQGSGAEGMPIRRGRVYVRSGRQTPAIMAPEYGAVVAMAASMPSPIEDGALGKFSTAPEMTAVSNRAIRRGDDRASNDQGGMEVDDADVFVVMLAPALWRWGAHGAEAVRLWARSPTPIQLVGQLGLGSDYAKNR